MFNSIDWLRFLELSYYLGLGSPFSTGFKSTIDPFLNLQEHVLTHSQVSFDVERATSIRIMLAKRENFAIAISPGSSSYLVTKVPVVSTQSLFASLRSKRIARKLERKQKKRVEGGGGGEKRKRLPASVPLP